MGKDLETDVSMNFQNFILLPAQKKIGPYPFPAALHNPAGNL
jgi:hypothetical protein